MAVVGILVALVVAVLGQEQRFGYGSQPLFQLQRFGHGFPRLARAPTGAPTPKKTSADYFAEGIDKLSNQPLYSDKYFKEKAQKCLPWDVIVSRDQCKEAAVELGIRFNKEDTWTSSRPTGCYWDREGHSFFNMNLENQDRTGGIYEGAGAICLRPEIRTETYFKEHAAMNCRPKYVIVSRDQCKEAAVELGIRFQRSSIRTSSRPAGCYWDSEGHICFNKNLDADAGNYQWAGGICSTVPVKYFKEDAVTKCPSKHVVTTFKECKEAAVKLGIPFDTVTPLKKTIERPPGCFWENGNSYFNQNLNADPGSTSSESVGGICRYIETVEENCDDMNYYCKENPHYLHGQKCGVSGCSVAFCCYGTVYLCNGLGCV